MHRALASYASAGSSTEADELIMKYAPAIDRVARRIVSRTGLQSAFDDLWSAGALGLVEAARRFDAGRGVSFETFVEHRIRGAMLDELRKTDWTPRSVHRKLREVSEVVRQIENETGADATDAEVIRRLGIDAQEYHQILADAASARLLSLSAPEDDEDGAALDVADQEGLGPQDRFEQEGMRGALVEAIGGLPEREQLVMSLYYEQELNLKEIGAVLGVTESRVCQIHGQALIRLRARMTGWREQGAAADSSKARKLKSTG